MPLSAFVASFVLPEARAGRLENFAIEKSSSLVKRLTASPKAAQEFFASIGKIAKRDITDGLRLTVASGELVHLRPSGNAPELRCYVEAANALQADALLARALKLLEECRN